MHINRILCMLNKTLLGHAVFKVAAFRLDARLPNYCVNY